MRTHSRALTLAELVIATMVTAMVGAAVVAVSTALFGAQAHTDSMTESIQSGRFAMTRIEPDVRKAELVTATGSGELALWTGDDNDDGQINIDEIVLIRYVTANGTLERWRVVFPDSMSRDLVKTLNVGVPLSQLTAIGSVRNALSHATYSSYLARTVLAADVLDFNVVADEAAPLTRLVLIRLKVGRDGQEITLTNAIRLRADATGSVKWADGAPVLNP